MGFYAVHCDSSYKNKVAKIEVDLINEKVSKWESLTDFDNKEIFTENGIYELSDMEEYLNNKIKSSENTSIGKLVLNYKSSNKIVLLCSIKKKDDKNFRNSELNLYCILDINNKNWKVIVKTENHDFEESGQILKHSKIYDQSNTENYLSVMNKDNINKQIDFVLNKYFNQTDTFPVLVKIFSEFVRKDANIKKEEHDWSGKEKTEN